MRPSNPRAVAVRGAASCKAIEIEEGYDPRSYCYSILSKPENICKTKDCSKSVKQLKDISTQDIQVTPDSICKTTRYDEKRNYSSDDTYNAQETPKQNIMERKPDQGKDNLVTEILYHHQHQNEMQSLSKQTMLSGVMGHFSEYDNSERIVLNTNLLDTNSIHKTSAGQANRKSENQHENIPRDARKIAEDSVGVLSIEVKSTKQPIIEKNFDKRHSEKSDNRAQHIARALKYDGNAVKLLKELKKNIGTRGVKAISHLVKPEICSCCKCMICKCKIRKKIAELTSSEEERNSQKERLKMEMAYSWTFDYFDTPDLGTFEKQRQERFEFERRLAEEEEVTLLLEELYKKEGIKRNEPEDDLKNKEIFEKMKKGKDSQKDGLKMELDYSWTYDYFDTPDMGFYEKQRQEKFELERRMAEEEEVTLLIEELLKEEGIKENKLQSDLKNKEIVGKMKEIISFGPTADTKQHSSPNSRKENMNINVDEMEEVKIQENSKEDTSEKYSDLKHAETKKSISEERSSRPRERVGKHKYGLNDDKSSNTSTSEELAGYRDHMVSRARSPTRHSALSSSRKPKRKKKLQKNINELRDHKIKRMSYKDSITLSQEEIQWNSVSTGTERKPDVRANEEALHVNSGEDNLIVKDSDNDSVYNKFGDAKITEEETEIQKSMSVIKLSSKLVLALKKASEAAKKRVAARRFTLHPTLRHYTDICNCLPGTCTCGSHYLFQNIKQSTPLNEEAISKETSCLCWHSINETVEEEEEVELVHDLTYSPFFHVILSQKGYMICPKQPKYEKTVIVLKPEASMYKDVVLRELKQEGLDIIDQRHLQLTPEEVTEIYDENDESAYFFMFIQQMSSTPIWVLSIAGISAIERWKKVTTENRAIHSSWFYPESIKRRFGLHTDIYGAMKISTDKKNAKKDLQYFFPLDILEPIAIDSIEVQDYCDSCINPTLLKALFMVAREKPENPLEYLAEWVLRNNPNTPSFTDSKISLAPT